MVDIVLIVNPGLSLGVRWKRYAWPEVPRKGETINILGLEKSGLYPVIRLQIEHIDHMFDDGYVAIQCWPKAQRDTEFYDELASKDSSWRSMSEEVPASSLAILRVAAERKRIKAA